MELIQMVNIVELKHIEFFLCADLINSGKWCWLTQEELRLVNLIRASKELPPVSIMDKATDKD